MSIHILIVEDTKSLADSIADFLRMEGFEVSLAINAESAIKAIAAKVPDLIITDLLMPGINGFEFIKWVRSEKRFNHIPIILLTAQTGSENRLEGERVGANAFLEKPFEEDDLLESIQRLTAR